MKTIFKSLTLMLMLILFINQIYALGSLSYSAPSSKVNLNDEYKDIAVLLKIQKINDVATCSGVLLDTIHMLTALHCIAITIDNNPYEKTPYMITNNTKIYKVGSSGNVINVPIAKAKKYYLPTPYPGKVIDLAIIEFEQPISDPIIINFFHNHTVEYENFNSSYASNNYEILHVYGWGDTAILNSQIMNSDSTKSYIPLDNSEINLFYSNIEFYIKAIIEVDPTERKAQWNIATNERGDYTYMGDTYSKITRPTIFCPGDSGAPIIHKILDPNETNNIISIAGIMKSAYVISATYGCSSSYIVQSFDSAIRDWITSYSSHLNIFNLGGEIIANRPYRAIAYYPQRKECSLM